MIIVIYKIFSKMSMEELIAKAERVASACIEADIKIKGINPGFVILDLLDSMTQPDHLGFTPTIIFHDHVLSPYESSPEVEDILMPSSPPPPVTRKRQTPESSTIPQKTKSKRTCGGWYQCDYCDASFRRPQGLGNHTRFHIIRGDPKIH